MNVQDLFGLSGKRALITGSSKGIGYALARGLSGAGAEIIINGRDAARLDQAAAGLREAGASVTTAVFDVTDPQAVRAGARKVSAAQRASVFQWWGGGLLLGKVFEAGNTRAVVFGRRLQHAGAPAV